MATVRTKSALLALIADSPIGVASSVLRDVVETTFGAAFPGVANTFTANQTLQDVDVVLGTTTGTKIGTAVGQKLGFHNATPVVQRAGAAQAAVASTAATNSSPYGYAQAQADAIVTLLNEIRAALVEKGIIKGAA